MKNLFFIVIISIGLFSCSKDDSSIDQNGYSNKTEILEFNSMKELDTKIKEILEIKKDKEFIIMQKILLKNNTHLPELGSNNLSNPKNLASLNYEDIEEDLKYYHKEKLGSIYDLRRQLGFTSIQSIADEINSLKILDPKKAESLFNDNNSLLIKSDYQTSVVFGEEISNVLNIDGKVKVNEEVLDYNLFPEKTKNTFMKAVKLDQGILVQDNLYSITWHAGRQRNYDWYSGRYDNYARLGSFIYTDIGPISYPSWFHVNQPSKAHFKTSSTSSGFNVSFASGSQTAITDAHQTRSRTYDLYEVHIQPSAFTTYLNGYWLTLYNQTLHIEY